MKRVFVKKVLALVVALSLAVAVLPVASAEEAYSDYPVVLLPGYSSSGLARVYEDGSAEQVWGVNTDAILQAVLARIAELALGLGLAASGSDPAYLAKVVGEESRAILDGVRCNPDGSSVYPVRRIYSEPENTNNAYYLSHPEEIGGMYERDIMGDIGDLIGDALLFNFNTDFRMGAIACAEQLQEYILKVLEYTGAEKVNLLAISHGGQVAGTYLSLYGTQGLVNNAVLVVPALGGAGIAYDFFNGDIDFDELTLVKFIEHGFMSETDYHWLVRAEATGFLDDVIRELVPYLLESVLYWGSLWDFMPPEYYEQMKARYLDSEESAALIAASDRMHYEIMPHYAENFAACQAAGVKIHIIAGTDSPIVTGLQENSDAIITTHSSTGALTAPYGLRFADGYRGQYTTCQNPFHVHISPAMTVDASTAYLPENTFFIEGLFHGMVYWDDYSSDLLEILLLTDQITDVHTDPRYSQFHATTNAEQAVTAYFDQSPEGQLGADDQYLIVKNLSSTHSLTLLNISCFGQELLIPAAGKQLAPGEALRLPVQGEPEAVSYRKMQITVRYYTSIAAGTPVGTRTLSFLVMNGESAVYDGQTPYAPLMLTESAFPQIAGDRATSVLEKIGILDFVEMFFDIFYAILQNIRLLFKLG